jgi:PHD/YefM family antitoxin component YafN of YafNO toxin-antitoxin module
MTIKRQFITSETGETVAVVLPVKEYQLVKDVLEKRLDVPEKLAAMKQAAHDPLFLQDLNEVMTDFAHSDSEWWEPNE